MLQNAVCATEGCQKLHIIKRIFASLLCVCTSSCRYLTSLCVVVRAARMIRIGFSSKNQFIFLILFLLSWCDSVQQCWEYNLLSLAVEMRTYDTELSVFIVKAIYECESVVQVQRNY